MKAIQRICVAAIEIIVFSIICCLLSGSFDYIRDTTSPFNFLFLSSAVFIILGQYIAEPFFTTPLGAISNSIAAILLLLAVNNPEYMVFYLPMMALFTALLACSVGVLALNTTDKAPTVKRYLLFLSSHLGKSKILYSVVFILGLISYLRNDPIPFAAMMIAWVIIVCTPFFEEIVSALFNLAKHPQHDVIKGVIVDSIPNRYYVVSFPSAAYKSIDASSHILLLMQGDGRWNVSHIVRIESLPSETIVSSICIPNHLIENRELRNSGIHPIAGDCSVNAMIVSKMDLGEDALHALNKKLELLAAKRIVGFIDEQSSIETVRIRLILNESDGLYQNIHEGTVVEASIKNERVMYQIINGVDRENTCNATTLTPFVQAYARKLGAYDPALNTIRNVMWLPELGSPVYMEDIDETCSSMLSIGRLPGTTYDICIADINALITHNTAILGILGVGKSCLTFELIQKIAQAEETQGARIICLDLTNEYEIALKNYGVDVCSPNDTDLVAQLKANYRTATKSKDEGGNAQVFRLGMQSIISDFMAGKYCAKVLVINPEKYEVSKQTSDGKSSDYGKPPYDLTPFSDLSPAELTRIISEEALTYCKATFAGGQEKAKLLLVFEEAHSLIPEWSSAANDGDRNAANGTARVILQGRKYGLGSFVITQRTANVSKSVLNQCNTVFALRIFDDTGKQFLENYVGPDYAAMLPTLEERHAIVAGKALRLTCPVEVRLNDRQSLMNAPLR